MSLLNRWLSSSRVRSAKKSVAKEPTARRYAELAQEYAVVGDLDAVLVTTDEGLKLFPGEAELTRLHDRARNMKLEGRTRELQVELAIAPRQALWKELCEILLESGRVARAEEIATEWYQATKSGEALYYRARARADRFCADRRRDDGRLAFGLVTSATEALPGDRRPLELHLMLASRVGAWADARRVLARLLEYSPGDPHLEARFRTIANLSDSSKTVDQALRDVEKSGRLVDDAPDSERAATAGSVRPMLQAILADSGVQAAFYVRGATALVQGPKGATAERTARGVREVVSSCRAAARKLGLGTAHEVCIEGDFGTLLVAPREHGSAAIWCTRTVTRQHEERLRELAGIAVTATEVDA